jgi:hypothetical protein
MPLEPQVLQALEFQQLQEEPGQEGELEQQVLLLRELELLVLELKPQPRQR